MSALASLATLAFVDCAGCAGAAALRCSERVHVLTGITEAPLDALTKKKTKKTKKKSKKDKKRSDDGAVAPVTASKRARKAQRVVDRSGQVVAVVADAPHITAERTVKKGTKRTKGVRTDADAVLAALWGGDGAADAWADD